MDKIEMLKENDLNDVVGGNNLNNLDLYKIAGITIGDKKWQFSWWSWNFPGIYTSDDVPEPKHHFCYEGNDISDGAATELVYYYFKHDCTKAENIQTAALFARSRIADFKSFISNMNVR